MKENEKITINGKEVTLYREVETNLYSFSKDAVDMLLESLEEREQYRAIGTVEHIQLTFELCKGLDAMAKMYESIGTIEEFKALKEKSTKKRFSIFESHGIRQFVCSCCDRPIRTTDNYCSFCGQKLDWQ